MKYIDYIHDLINSEVIVINNGKAYSYAGCAWSRNADDPNEQPWMGFEKFFPYTYQEVVNKKFDEIHPF